MERSELLRLARLGAEARLRALETEVQAIYRSFPDLRSARAVKVPRANGRVAQRRNRWKMSAAQRKAVSARMKKYWASRRKATGKG